MSKTVETTKVITGEVRFSYMNVIEPKSINGSEPKYSVSLLIPKSDTKTIAAINKAIEAAKQAGIGKFGGKIPAKLKMPMRDGDVDKTEDEAYSGHYFINANSAQKPGLVDANLNPIMDRTEIYSGCYGRASINFYAFNTKGNKGIACGLNNLMKTRDGEPLSGRASAEADFADFANNSVDDEDFLK